MSEDTSKAAPAAQDKLPAETPLGAFIQKDRKTYAVVPRTPLGLVTPEVLERIAAVARGHGIPIIKITSGQRMALVGVRPDDVENVWKDLGMEIGRAVEPCMHYVQACPGSAVCRFGVRDSLGMGGRLDKELAEMGSMPSKLKVGVSGCPFCCAEAYVRDMGIFGKKSGWTVILGGNSGQNPRIGDVVARDVDDDRVVGIARAFVDMWRAGGGKRERTARFVERVGIAEVLSGLGIDAATIGDNR